MQTPQLVLFVELFHEWSERQEALKNRIHVAGLGQVGQPETAEKAPESERQAKLAPALRRDPLPVAGQLVCRQQAPAVLQCPSGGPISEDVLEASLWGDGPPCVPHVTLCLHVRSHTLFRLKAKGHGRMNAMNVGVTERA